MKKLIIPITVALSLFCLTSCATGTQGTQGDVMGRSLIERINDGNISLLARRALSNIEGMTDNNVRIAIDSYRRDVLLTGEVPSEYIKQQVEQRILSVRDVDKVFNHLTVIDIPKSQSHTVHENYLRSKIHAKLLLNPDIKSSQYKIVVRDQTAYVMGDLTPAQQNDILNAIQNTSGMAMAVTLTTVQYEGVPPQTPPSYPINEQQTPAIPTPSPATTTTGTYPLTEIYLPEAQNDTPYNATPVLGTR